MEEKFKQMEAEMYLCKRLYYACIFMKVFAAILLIGFIYSKMGLYDLISFNTFFAFFSCLFIQVTIVIFDYFISRQLNRNICCAKRIKKEFPEAILFPLKNENKFIHIFLLV